MIIVWVNKRNWKKPGPIVNMAVHNAASFAIIGFETHLCIGEGVPSDSDEDLKKFYGIDFMDGFHVHRFARFKLGKS